MINGKTVASMALFLILIYISMGAGEQWINPFSPASAMEETILWELLVGLLEHRSLDCVSVQVPPRQREQDLEVLGLERRGEHGRLI